MGSKGLLAFATPFRGRVVPGQVLACIPGIMIVKGVLPPVRTWLIRASTESGAQSMRTTPQENVAGDLRRSVPLPGLRGSERGRP
jgi:hypothetical protein